MPITQWKCSGCGGREVPLDHFEKTECGVKVCHPHFARAVYNGREGHYANKLGLPEVSHALGCPRQAAIFAQEDIAVDPLDFNSPETGSAFHDRMADAVTEGSQVEVVLRGEIAGRKVVGKCDILRRDLLLVEDWKHHNDKFLWMFHLREEDPRRIEKRAQSRDIAQLSFYAEMCEQTQGWRPTRGIIWSHFTFEFGWPLEFPLMDEKTLQKFQPLNGPYTTMELLDATIEWQGGKSWKKLKLYGELMMYGKKQACKYCAVETLCKKQAKGTNW